MNGQKKKPHGGNRGASQTAMGREAIGGRKHTPPEIAASCLLLATAIASARTIAARMASETDRPPFGPVDAADSLAHACELLALIVTGEVDHAPE